MFAPREGKLMKVGAYSGGRIVEYETDILDYAGDETSRGYILNVFFAVEMDADGNPVISENGVFEGEEECAWYYEDGSIERIAFGISSIIE
jgi:hypothetical protein